MFGFGIAALLLAGLVAVSWRPGLLVIAGGALTAAGGYVTGRLSRRERRP